MNQRQFYKTFQTEEDCILHLKSILEEKNISCSKCGNKKLKWNAKNLNWRCKCMRKISVKSLTFMRDSNLPLLKWFEAIYLFTKSKKPSSDLNICEALEIHQYKTAHYLLMKIRRAMSKNLEQLSFDSFFQYQEDENNQCKLLIQKSKSRKVDNIRLVLPKGETKVYSFMQSPKYHMKKIVLPEIKTSRKIEQLQWIQNTWRMTISNNYKAIVNGIHHYITNFHAQLYLDEYCYKYNLRYCKNRFEHFFNECILVEL